MKITFGKYAGTELSELSPDYLQWLQDLDRHPQGIVRDGVNWSELAHAELQRRENARQQEIEQSPVLFTHLAPGTYTGTMVRLLTRELVAAIRSGAQIQVTTENVKKMMYKAGYKALPVMACAELIVWATQAALNGKRPVGVGSDLQAELWDYMDDQGNFCDERQSHTETYS